MLAVLCDKWRAPVLLSLTGQTLRYGELSRCIPNISRTMLTRTLRDLERGGLVNRQVFAVVPSKVEYSLTEPGLRLTAILATMNEWALANEAELQSVHLNIQRKT